MSEPEAPTSWLQRLRSAIGRSVLGQFIALVTLVAAIFVATVMFRAVIGKVALQLEGTILLFGFILGMMGVVGAIVLLLAIAGITFLGGFLMIRPGARQPIPPLSARRHRAYVASTLSFAAGMYFAPAILDDLSTRCPAPADVMTVDMADGRYRVDRRHVLPGGGIPAPSVRDCGMISARASTLTFRPSSRMDGERLRVRLTISRTRRSRNEGYVHPPSLPDAMGPPESLPSGILNFQGVYYLWPASTSPAASGEPLILDCRWRTLDPADQYCMASYLSRDGEWLEYFMPLSDNDPRDWAPLDARVRAFVASMRVR